jgi:hypothetical protein
MSQYQNASESKESVWMMIEFMWASGQFNEALRPKQSGKSFGCLLNRAIRKESAVDHAQCYDNFIKFVTRPSLAREVVKR